MATPNGFDPLWIRAINNVLENRERNIKCTDLTDELWERYIGPLIDEIEGQPEITKRVKGNA